MKYLLALVTVCALSVAVPARALDLYQGAQPQAQTNTCQSYASVLSLAAAKDPAFPVETFDQLRVLEREFRSILEGLDNSNPYLHTNWPLAMQRLTGGAYTFELEYVPDLLDWMTTVRGATTLSDDLGKLIATVTGGPVDTVLTSVTSIDGSTYGTGHVVTVMGLLGSGIDSNTQLIAFNSAIKGNGGSVNQCEPGNQPGDTRYQAGVVQTNNFALRKFSGAGFLLMRLTRN